MRHAGDRLQSRLGAGSDRRRRDGLHRRGRAGRDRRGRPAAATVAGQDPRGISSSASRRAGWRRTISRSIAADGRAPRRICSSSSTQGAGAAAARRRPAIGRKLRLPAATAFRPAGRVSGIDSQTATRPTPRLPRARGRRPGCRSWSVEVAGQRRAERRADPDRGADDALREIEVSGPARDIGDHQRHHHAEHGRGDAVEQSAPRPAMAGRSPTRTASPRIGKRGECQQQQRAPAPDLRAAGRPRARSSRR